MKIVLTILCAIVVLFAGGCALLALIGSAASLEAQLGSIFIVLPGGLAVLNVLVIAALWGKMKPPRGVFLALAIIDAIAAAVLALVWSEIGFYDSEANTFMGIATGVVAVKGLLTFLYWLEFRPLAP